MNTVDYVYVETWLAEELMSRFGEFSSVNDALKANKCKVVEDKPGKFVLCYENGEEIAHIQVPQTFIV